VSTTAPPAVIQGFEISHQKWLNAKATNGIFPYCFFTEYVTPPCASTQFAYFVEDDQVLQRDEWDKQPKDTTCDSFRYVDTLSFAPGIQNSTFEPVFTMDQWYNWCNHSVLKWPDASVTYFSDTGLMETCQIVNGNLVLNITSIQFGIPSNYCRITGTASIMTFSSILQFLSIIGLIISYL